MKKKYRSDTLQAKVSKTISGDIPLPATSWLLQHHS